jgi:hypothetical protein
MFRATLHQHYLWSEKYQRNELVNQLTKRILMLGISPGEVCRLHNPDLSCDRLSELDVAFINCIVVPDFRISRKREFSCIYHLNNNMADSTNKDGDFQSNALLSAAKVGALTG